MIDLHGVEAVLFDLDGTLVNVDMERFVPSYLRGVTGHMSDQVDSSRAIRAFHRAVGVMFANTDAGRTLETILLEVLQEDLNVSPDHYAQSLELFCQNGLARLRPLVSGHPLASLMIASALNRDCQVVLATNPIFPRAVIDARIGWGGLSVETFDLVTAYETAHFCKPNPAYFEELLEWLHLPAEACLMIGNDTLHDLAASQVGMQTCLLTPWQIDRGGTRFKADWQGVHEDLLALMESGGAVNLKESAGPD